MTPTDLETLRERVHSYRACVRVMGENAVKPFDEALTALLAERDALRDAAQYELKGWRLEHEDTSYFYLEDEEEVNSLIAEGYTAVPLYKKINTTLSKGKRG